MSSRKEIRPLPNMMDPLTFPFEKPNEEAISAYDKKYQLDIRVQRVLDSDGELPAGEYNNLFNHLQNKRNSFVDGTKQQKALAIRDINTKAEAVKAYKSFRQDLAAAYNTKQLMKGWVNSPQGTAIMDLLKDRGRLVQKTCPGDMNCPHRDELGVIMPDFKAVDNAEKRIRQLDIMFEGINKKDPRYEDARIQYETAREELENVIKSGGEKWTAVSNLKKMIQMKDNTSKDVLQTMANNYLNLSTQTQNIENKEFPGGACEQQVKATLISKAKNKKSLVYDEMIIGRTFYQDLLQEIKRTTPWGDDPEKVKMIADSMVNDPQHEKALDDELVKYFTGYIKKQWDMGRRNRPDPTKEAPQNPAKKKLGKPMKYVPGAITAQLGKQR